MVIIGKKQSVVLFIRLNVKSDDFQNILCIFASLNSA